MGRQKVHSRRSVVYPQQRRKIDVIILISFIICITEPAEGHSIFLYFDSEFSIEAAPHLTLI